MYFETGQGSALSADANFGVDQQTCEARAYALARRYKPLLVNTVVGFIGPEYLYDGKQIIRAGLEDHFCGKLLGLPLGCDICYTNHAEADQDDMDTLLVLLGAAGISFIMGVPGADDVMLNYQSTSFHDALFLRETMGLKRAPEFEAWLQRMQITDADGRLRPPSPNAPARPAWAISKRWSHDEGLRSPPVPGANGAASRRRASRSAAPARACRPTRCCASAGPTRWRAMRFTRRSMCRRSKPRCMRKAGPSHRCAASAPDRVTYLRRPDLGRALDAARCAELRALNTGRPRASAS